MKTILTASLALLALPAAAHDMGGAHLHPHVDPTVFMAALVATGVAAWVLLARR